MGDLLFLFILQVILRSLLFLKTAYSAYLSATYIGCYTDRQSSRALPTFLGYGYQGDKPKCFSEASTLGCTVVGLQDGRECWCGNDLNEAEKYGTSGGCGDFGGSDALAIYSLVL
jgi:hypothetical protein